MSEMLTSCAKAERLVPEMPSMAFIINDRPKEGFLQMCITNMGHSDSEDLLHVLAFISS